MFIPTGQWIGLACAVVIHSPIPVVQLFDGKQIKAALLNRATLVGVKNRLPPI